MNPDKALFDEVKNLKIEMEEIRSRIFKIESVYTDKIESIESIQNIYKDIDLKLKEYNASLNTMKIILIDGKRIPLFEKTIRDNIYISQTLLDLFEDKLEDEIIIDDDYYYFNIILNIIKRGHNYYMLNNTEKELYKRNYELEIKNIEIDELFIQILKHYFHGPYLDNVIIDYKINCTTSLKGIDIKNIIINTETYDKDNLTEYILPIEEKSQLLNATNNKALFLNFNSSIIIILNKTIKINKLFIRKFKNSNKIDFDSLNNTSYQYYVKVFLSNDGTNYKYAGNIHRYTAQFEKDEDYYELNIGLFTSFNYIKLLTSTNSKFAINYITFK